MVKMMIENAADMDVADKQQQNIIHKAAKSNSLEVLECVCDKLVERGRLEGKINTRDLNHPISVHEVPFSGVNANGENSEENQTPMNLAIARKFFEGAQKLAVKYKANVDIPDSLGLTPLHFAALWGEPDLVCDLVERCKAKVEVKTTRHGETPAMMARSNGHTNIYNYMESKRLPEPSNLQVRQKLFCVLRPHCPRRGVVLIWREILCWLKFIDISCNKTLDFIIV